MKRLLTICFLLFFLCIFSSCFKTVFAVLIDDNDCDMRCYAAVTIWKPQPKSLPVQSVIDPTYLMSYGVGHAALRLVDERQPNSTIAYYSFYPSQLLGANDISEAKDVAVPGQWGTFERDNQYRPPNTIIRLYSLNFNAIQQERSNLCRHGCTDSCVHVYYNLVGNGEPTDMEDQPPKYSCCNVISHLLDAGGAEEFHASWWSWYYGSPAVNKGIKGGLAVATPITMLVTPPVGLAALALTGGLAYTWDKIYGTPHKLSENTELFRKIERKTQPKTSSWQ